MTLAQINLAFTKYGRNNLLKIYTNNPGYISVPADEQHLFTFDDVNEVLEIREYQTAYDTFNYHSRWTVHFMSYPDVQGLIFNIEPQPPAPV
jgi:hypothetical protein